MTKQDQAHQKRVSRAGQRDCHGDLCASTYARWNATPAGAAWRKLWRRS